MNPFAQKAAPVAATLESLAALYPRAYHPMELSLIHI